MKIKIKVTQVFEFNEVSNLWEIILCLCSGVVVSLDYQSIDKTQYVYM